MRQKFISLQVQLACRSQLAVISKDIHTHLQETIAERNRILPDWERLFLDDNTDAASIHIQLKNTIGELKRIKLVYQDFFGTEPGSCNSINETKAA